ncbi:MAG: DUF3999 family protein [Terriglobales bacterium]
MKSGSFLLALALALALIQGPSISYFTNTREIRVQEPGVQNYFVVDEEIWKRARPDLADLRIYDGTSQVQYALREQRAATSSQETAAKILNLGSVGGRTEFDLDMRDIAEYDRIRVNLEAKDFVVTALLAGSDQLGAKAVTKLPPATLYDFSREELGSNTVLKLPASSFRYLHVTLSAGIAPAQIKGASVYNLQETKAVWTSVGSCSSPSQTGRTTVITCNSPPRVPVDRIRFQVDPKQVNFRRVVTLSDASDYGTGGEITRVRINRGGTSVVSEQMDVPVADRSSGQLRITVDNGDNPPLAVTGVQLLSVERRVYFDPEGETLLRLYYGDDRLGSPVYDYARFFKADPKAARAELGAGTHNEAYKGRPDERPWSERHKGVLWAAMILAVIVLAGLALRGLKTNAVSS